jgi:hypothetical protein
VAPWIANRSEAALPGQDKASGSGCSALPKDDRDGPLGALCTRQLRTVSGSVIGIWMPSRNRVGLDGWIMKAVRRKPKVGISLLIGGMVLLASCGATRPASSHSSTSLAPTTTAPPTTTTTSTTTTTPKQTLPPLSLGTLAIPSDYTCSAGLYFLSPANQASGECVPHAYVVGGTPSDPDDDTACPAGSSMSMGPVECDNDTGMVTPVPPGPNTCSSPGGPCPSSTLTLSSQASVIPWAAIEFPTGKCPAGYYFGEAGGDATCVPYSYLPGGTAANPNDNTACPPGSGLKVAELTGTLCEQDAEPSEIVAPVPAKSS